MTQPNDELNSMMLKATENKTMREMRHRGFIPRRACTHAPVVHDVYLDCQICNKQCFVM